MEKSLSKIYVQKNATFKHQRKIYILLKKKNFTIKTPKNKFTKSIG